MTINIPPIQQAMPRVLNTQDEKKLKEAVGGFESIFMQQILASMRRTLSEDGLMSGGQGEKMFREMLDQEYAKQLSSQQNQRGLKEEMFRQLTMARTNHIAPLPQETPPREG